MSVEHLIVFLQTVFWRADNVCFTQVFQMSFRPGAWPPGQQQQPQVLLPGEKCQEVTQLNPESRGSLNLRIPSSQVGGWDFQVVDGENSHP